MRVSKTAAKRFVAAVGAKVRDERKALRLTQQDLAERLDAWVPQVSMLEAGQRNLRLSDLYRVAVALETTPSELVDVEIEPQAKQRSSKH